MDLSSSALVVKKSSEITIMPKATLYSVMIMT